MPGNRPRRAWALPAALAAAGLAFASGCVRQGDSGAHAKAAGSVAQAADSSAIEPLAPADLQRLRESPQAQDWRRQKRFEQDARAFIREAPGLSAAEREARARRLDAEMDERERAGELSAGESMLLRAAMVEAQAGNEEERAARLAGLVRRYQEDAARRQAAWLARQQSDPRLQQYKRRERAVVEEVMAMDRFPGGMTRDQYLRQRLQREREAAWGKRD